MAFLDGLIAPEEQDVGPGSLYPWLTRRTGTPPILPMNYPPPTAPPMPAGRTPARPAPAPSATPSVLPGSTLSAVPVGPGASTAPPAVQNAPLAPVTLGAAQPPAPQTAADRLANAKAPVLSGWKKVLDVVGQARFPGIEEAIPGTPGYFQTRTLPTLQREAGQEQKVQVADLARRKDEAEITRSGAETANLQAEAQARLNPQPKTKPIVIADENGNPVPALQDEKTGAVTDPTGTPIINPKMWEKPIAPKEPSEQDRIAREWIDAHPKDYPPDASGNRYIASNMAKARIAAKAAESAATEKPPRTLLEVPQADGTSKIIEATPGMTVPAGARTPTQAGNINQMEQTRADMAENVNENLSQLEDIVKRRPDLFGKVAGRATKFREWIGTNDQDIAAMQQIEDNLGRAMTSAHGMRNGQLVEKATRGILNSYKNGPDAVRSAINEARNSVKTFTADVESKGGKTGAEATPAGESQKIIKYDNKGNVIP